MVVKFSRASIPCSYLMYTLPIFIFIHYRAMDYLSLLEHTQSIIFEQFPDIEIKVLYVCKPNMVPKLSPVALRDANFGVVTVCRTPESDLLRNTLSAKWNGVITVGTFCVLLVAYIVWYTFLARRGHLLMCCK